MKKPEIHKLDLDNIFGVKNLISFRKIKNRNKNNIKDNKQYLKETKIFKSFDNNINYENEKNQNEELANIFNKTVNNKIMFLRKNTKEVSFKLNNNIDDIKKKEESNDNESKNEFKNLIRNFSPNSKESTMYKTRKKSFISSKQLKNNFNSITNFINNRRKNTLEYPIIRSFSANNLTKNLNKNNN